jgi:hypothetical protein
MRQKMPINAETNIHSPPKFPMYIILWISQSRCLTSISACDPAYMWLQST